MSDIVALIVLLVLLAIVAALVAAGYFVWQRYDVGSSGDGGQTTGKPSFAKDPARNMLYNAAQAIGGPINAWLRGLLGIADPNKPAPEPTPKPAPMPEPPKRPDAPFPSGLEGFEVFGFNPLTGTVGEFLQGLGKGRKLNKQDFFDYWKEKNPSLSLSEIGSLYATSDGYVQE